MEEGKKVGQRTGGEERERKTGRQIETSQRKKKNNGPNMKQLKCGMTRKNNGFNLDSKNILFQRAILNLPDLICSG